MLVRRRKVGVLVMFAGIAFSLAGCQTEYRGYDSGIDGTLWRQIASFEDPLSRELFSTSTTDAVAYLDSLQGERWNGQAETASDLPLHEGGVILYDMSSSESSAEVSVFISSGPRPNVPTDDGRDYHGPSRVFTCYQVRVTFAAAGEPWVERGILDDCPTALVELLPDGAAFASGEVFDG